MALPQRVVVALGGNAMTGPDGSAAPAAPPAALPADELDAALAARGLPQRTVAVVTRTLVDPADPGFTNPSKPVGRYVPREEAQRFIQHGQVWEDRGSRAAAWARRSRPPSGSSREPAAAPSSPPSSRSPTPSPGTATSARPCRRTTQPRRSSSARTDRGPQGP